MKTAHELVAEAKAHVTEVPILGPVNTNFGVAKALAGVPV